MGKKCHLGWWEALSIETCSRIERKGNMHVIECIQVDDC